MQNTSTCTTTTSEPRRRNGTGRSQGTKPANIATTAWSANIFAMSRIESDIGRTMWLITSTTKKSSIKGSAYHLMTGPKKCLKYASPCSLTPKMCVVKKITIAHASVTDIELVGGKKPGIKPI